ncbi:MAG: hypothetical protein OXH04_15545, partial [Acidobacteria bacterium]|nr:hypothetical protein [Acidobacteriota bacterium]
MTTHSVRRHLRLEIAAYDETIRHFIPGYEPMLAAAAREVAAGVSRARRAAGAAGGGRALDGGGGPRARAGARRAPP